MLGRNLDTDRKAGKHSEFVKASPKRKAASSRRTPKLGQRKAAAKGRRAVALQNWDKERLRQSGVKPPHSKIGTKKGCGKGASSRRTPKLGRRRAGPKRRQAVALQNWDEERLRQSDVEPSYSEIGTKKGCGKGASSRRTPKRGQRKAAPKRCQATALQKGRQYGKWLWAYNAAAYGGWWLIG